MIDFSKVEIMNLPEGRVKDIKDASGNMLWRYITPVSLTVEKRTISTRNGQETCVLLDIYPKSANSIVRVTYEGYTKVLTFTNTNFQTVFFGTYLGQTDPVSTPASGVLTIGGDCLAFGSGSYIWYGGGISYAQNCPCITGVANWGEVEIIPDNAFISCTSLSGISIPSRITRIGECAFSGCNNVKPTSFSNNLTYIGAGAFETIVEKYVDYAGVMIHNPTLPISLLELGLGAFCVAVMNEDEIYPRFYGTLTVKSTTPPTMGYTNGYGAFGSPTIVSRKIKVPTGCSAAYKSAPGWSLYADWITE